MKIKIFSGNFPVVNFISTEAGMRMKIILTYSRDMIIEQQCSIHNNFEINTLCTLRDAI